MNKIELVFSDIDGTLLNSKHEVTAEAIQIIKEYVSIFSMQTSETLRVLPI